MELRRRQSPARLPPLPSFLDHMERPAPSRTIAG
jgi:hypothetical protein